MDKSRRASGETENRDPGVDMTDQVRRFREKLAAGPVLGPFSKTRDPAFIEIMGYAGFDFVILDLEHGPNSVETAENLVRAAQIADILPVVRVKEGYLPLIGEVLDIGSGAVQVPQITTAQDARLIVETAKFHPGGMRGVCRYVRAARYSSKDQQQYFQDANECLVILQLEGKEALANLDSIMLVEGVDILFVGPYDLSQSLGVPGQVQHPTVEKQIREIATVCR
jgi:4-hydroxy-2-oxoheptanedioate aldolase